MYGYPPMASHQFYESFLCLMIINCTMCCEFVKLFKFCENVFDDIPPWRCFRNLVGLAQHIIEIRSRVQFPKVICYLYFLVLEVRKERKDLTEWVSSTNSSTWSVGIQHISALISILTWDEYVSSISLDHALIRQMRNAPSRRKHVRDSSGEFGQGPC